jgi:hypothetical protein
MERYMVFFGKNRKELELCDHYHITNPIINKEKKQISFDKLIFLLKKAYIYIYRDNNFGKLLAGKYFLSEITDKINLEHFKGMDEDKDLLIKNDKSKIWT